MVTGSSRGAAEEVGGGENADRCATSEEGGAAMNGTQSVILHIDKTTSDADLVDGVKDALVALHAPLRFHREKLCWRVVDEYGKPKHLTLTTKRLEYFAGKLGIKFERINADGRYEPVAAPREVLRSFIALAQNHQWYVDEWEEE